MESYRLLDSLLEEAWSELEDIPFDEVDDSHEMVLAEDWRGFGKGTERAFIWRFFTKHHSKGLNYLLY